MALKKEFNIKENEIILGNVGSFSENKNQSFLIKSLYELHKNNKNYRLILVGDGEMRKKLKKEVVILGLQEYVLFTGVRSDIPEIMHLFDIFLFPSIHEGLGIVAIEAQASGVPCIISDSVPHEVELGVGLVKFLSLDVNKWIEMIKFYNFDNCFKYTANTNFIFDINTACQKLIGIYKKN